MPGETVSRNVAITNVRGLHARAAARFVRLAETFEAVVEVEKDGSIVPGTSIMGLMMLAASPGSTIEIRATGPGAQDALDALVELVEDRFGEE